MEINRLKVADAINELAFEPFTCADILLCLRIDCNNKNKQEVEKILLQFKKRKWLHNSINNGLYWRTFVDFEF